MGNTTQVETFIKPTSLYTVFLCVISPKDRKISKSKLEYTALVLTDTVKT